MIYTPLTRLASRICYDAHKDVMDKNGVPYVFHPYHVAEQMDDEISVAVALLHDVVEDTEMTFDGLRSLGIPESVIGPLKLLTHEEGVPYMDYIRPIKTDETATKVKLADLAHNMDKTRWGRPMTERENQKYELYCEARAYLLSE